MKKIVTIILVLIFIIGVFSSIAIMANGGVSLSEPVVSIDNLKVGDYFTLGKYNDVPILWRYVADDENGKLIVSDKVLCEKRIGPINLWAESHLRKWLNSDVSEGEVDWGYVLSYDTFDVRRDFDLRGSQFDKEKGFLHETNFSRSERAVMKSVNQWTMLPQTHLELAENGEIEVYNPVKGFTPHMGINEPSVPIVCDIAELPNYYVGAAHLVADTVFLLDEMQIHRIWSNFGTPTNDEELRLNPLASHKHSYMLRTLSSINYYGGYSLQTTDGIRPAFYLDTDNAVILSGSGTEDDPYVIDGMDGETSPQKPEGGIGVFINGTRLEFDQPPIMDSDRVLVPMRFIFESLGAVVSWEEETQTVSVVKDDTTIFLQIGSNELIKNGETILLDVPAKLLNNRTLVPIRAVSEALGAGVEWVEETETVMIRT